MEFLIILLGVMLFMWGFYRGINLIKEGSHPGMGYLICGLLSLLILCAMVMAAIRLRDFGQ